MLDSTFSSLDLIGKTLEKHKDRLGPLYRPLDFLNRALTFLVLVAAMIGWPLLVFDKIVHVVAMQILLIVVYFMLLLAIRQSVFDRFAFCAVLFVVLTAAPVAIHVESTFHHLESANPEHADNLQAGFSASEVFSYGVIRGIGNTAWALPLLFYFYTFYPSLKSGHEDGVRKALDTSVRVAVALQLVAAGLIIWLEAVFQRAFASTDGAANFVTNAIQSNQRGFLAFSLLYLVIGFVAIGLAKARRLAGAGNVLLVVVAALVAVQFCYAIASYNVRELDERYPAARSTAAAIVALRSRATNEIVFLRDTSFRYVGKENLDKLRVYSACRNPESGRFSQLIASALELNEQFTQVDLGYVRVNERDKLFCQQS